MDIAGSGIIVTGAGSGLGAATAAMVVAQGGFVVIADVNREQGSEMAANLGASATFVPVDVMVEADCLRAIAAAQAAPKGLRGVVNCAGVAISERVSGRDGPHDLGRFTRCVTVNLIGTFNMNRLAADHMARLEPLGDGERGVLINTASVAAFDGQIGQAAYAASKAGVAGMTLPMARELAARGIRVVTIAPGLFETPMLASLPEPARLSLGLMTPFPNRLGRPEEYADLAAAIFANVMLNGEVIRLDGALRLAAK
jgi:NAD(P)-dependent dehydrogenase (short-subunit alcohol dehydrogenase family)